MGKFRTGLALVASTAAAVLLGLGGDSTCALAQSSSCRSMCLAEYNHCRIASKGSPSCDAQYQSCLQNCITTRR